MKRLLMIVLAAMLAMNSMINIAPIRAQVGTPSGPDGANQSQKGFSPEQEQALRELAPKLSRFDVDENGVPSWLMGDLGPAVGDPHRAAMEALRRLAPAFRMTADDSFEVRKSGRDEGGQTHVRLQQRYRGLPVVGGEMIVHLEGEKIVGVNGHFMPDINVGNTPKLTAETALATARQALPARDIQQSGSPELVVFVSDPDPDPWLAWSQTVAYVDKEGDSQRDQIFADAQNGRLLGRHAQIHTAKFRKVYDCNNTTQLPGTLVWQEGQIAVGLDQAENGARNGTGRTYDFYKNVFGRDSYDNAGAQLISSVHYGVDYNNAGWDKTLKQMIYGDGDGVLLGLTSTGLDVTAHELTHGVTQFEANLVYQDESGALNEATSDILGESVDYFFNGSTDWKVGEDIFTPGVMGDALRYMNDPVLDDPQVPDGPPYHFVSSRDYYPDRYTGSYDHGGVHFNSGIANLFFYLLSVGGTHPQGKTNVVVPAIGIEQARHIWYRALRDYMNATDGFADARDATAEAAAQIYKCAPNLRAAIVDAVHVAWDAVGVPNNAQNAWALLGLNGPSFNNGVQICFPATFNLLLNNNFENGKVIWTASPLSLITDSPAKPAYSGTWKAWMGGDGTAHAEVLLQKVTIPSVAASATLAFRLRIDSAESSALVKDTLQVQLLDQNGNLLTTLDTYSNLDENNSYTLQSFNVTAYAGQTVWVYFIATENASNQTSFVIDDTALNVN